MSSVFCISGILSFRPPTLFCRFISMNWYFLKAARQLGSGVGNVGPPPGEGPHRERSRCDGNSLVRRATGGTEREATLGPFPARMARVWGEGDPRYHLLEALQRPLDLLPRRDIVLHPVHERRVRYPPRVRFRFAVNVSLCSRPTHNPPCQEPLKPRDRRDGRCGALGRPCGRRTRASSATWRRSADLVVCGFCWRSALVENWWSCD